jgi:hypothetical protein
MVGSSQQAIQIFLLGRSEIARGDRILCDAHRLRRKAAALLQRIAFERCPTNRADELAHRESESVAPHTRVLNGELGSFPLLVSSPPAPTLPVEKDMPFVGRTDGEWQARVLQAQGQRQAEVEEAEGQRQAAILRAQGFAQALSHIHEVARDVDSNTMSLQYFDTLRRMGESDATKFILPLEFTSLLQPLLKHRQDSGGDGDRAR